MHFSTTTVLAALATCASAYGPGKRTFAVLRFYGDGPLTSGRMDPIVTPALPASHVHAIQGGNGFAPDMTDDQALTKSTCTSSLIKNDKSNYWTPSLYFKDPKTGSLTSVKMSYMNVYYFFDGTDDEIKAFPPGLRMFVGNANLRTPPSSASNVLDLSQGEAQPIQWTCPRKNMDVNQYPDNSDGLHGAGIQDPGNKGQGIGFPDRDCDGLYSPMRADIHFPSCYNPAKGLRNYKENMEWPTNGNCPKGYIHVPHLFYEVYWDTQAFADKWTQGEGTTPWVLSNGDPTGYSLHGDFISGWDEKTLQTIIDTCDAGSSGMDKCPTIIGGTNLNNPNSCNIENLVPETIFGTMAKLPGSNPIGAWGVNSGGNAAPAPVNSAPQASPTKASPTKPASGSTTTKGAIFQEGEPETAAPASSAAPVVISPAEIPSKPSATKPASSKPAAVQPQPNPQTPAPSVPETEAGSGSGSGGSNTLITSYISETTVVWTTVTADAPGPSSISAPSGWTYKGCFRDQRSARVLSGLKFANIGQHAVTSTKCASYCEERGFSLAGTEFGGQCFCDNELAQSDQLAEDKCTMVCEGDEAEICGGGDALSVFEKVDGQKIRRGRHLHRHAAARNN